MVLLDLHLKAMHPYKLQPMTPVTYGQSKHRKEEENGDGIIDIYLN